MIDRFNEMLQSVAERCDNAHYIDCRPVVQETDWYNEIHPKSNAFGKIAVLFDEKIRTVTSVERRR